MKNIILFILSLFFTATSSFAETLVYCPQEIHCSVAGDASSCSFTGGTPQYWDDITPSANIEANDYYYSGSNLFTDLNSGTCVYETKPNNLKTISFKSKTGVLLQIPKNLASHWVATNQHLWSCRATQSIQCPMEVKVTP